MSSLSRFLIGNAIERTISRQKSPADAVGGGLIFHEMDYLLYASISALTLASRAGPLDSQ